MERVMVVGQAADYVFVGGGTLSGVRTEHLLADGSAPSDFRVLLDGPPPRAPRQYDDGQRREWDVYVRDGSDESGRPLFQYQGQEITGVS
jgi:hypothetical protein